MQKYIKRMNPKHCKKNKAFVSSNDNYAMQLTFLYVEQGGRGMMSQPIVNSVR